MHLTPQTLAAAGNSPWIIPSPMPEATNIGLALSFSSNANLTANVQYSYDDPMQNPRPVTLTRVAAVLTVNDPGHQLNVGDSVTLANPNSDPNNIWGPTPPNEAPNAGTSYDVASIVDQNNYTVAVANAGSLGPAAGTVRSFRLLTVAALTAISGAPPARKDGSLGWPVGAIRLNVSAWTAGSVTLTVQQAKGY